MRLILCLLVAAFPVLGLSVVQAGEKPGDYLTKDGKLKEPIEVRELQGGFAGFTGTFYLIEPDGSWGRGAVPPRAAKDQKLAPKAQGKLTAEQLADLAKEFARYNLANLPNHGKPVVNPQVVRIRFGTKVSELQPARGNSTPEEDQTIRARYQGIAQAVKSLCKESKK
ncbi:MAG TPA: hypothetical protein VEL76_12565 [Gemmataceae bacterium]|nr:hypothetical protein [Gemmataceae bacterium]